MPPSKAQRAKTAQRRTQAIALRIAGAEWDAIAQTLGYADRAAACKDVTRALETYVAEQRVGIEVLRETELQRLDRLQRALWAQALAGDAKAVDTVLRVIDRRMRLLGLDMSPDVEAQMRQQLAAHVGAQIFTVVGKILDGLGLTDEQRHLVPELVQQAVMSMSDRPREIEGEVAA